MSQLLSPRQFAAAIGVSESSVRRWADSGRIRMTRTAGGHRKIAQPEAIRFVRESSAVVVRPDLLLISEPTHRRQRAEAFAAQHDQLTQALEEGDAELVSGLLTRLYLNGVSVAEICDGPLCTSMRCIGEKWPDDKRGIFLEHRATNICIDAMHRLSLSFTRPDGKAPVALGGAPESDPYVLPSLMATTVLAEAGFEAVNLGSNTPFQVLSQSALEMRAELVWIAVTSSLPKAATERGLAEVAKQLKRKSHIVIGGRGTRRIQVPAATHVHLCGSMSEMAGFARGLLASRQGEKASKSARVS